MSEVEAVNENVTDVADARPSVAVTRPPKKEADPAAAEREAGGTEILASASSTAESRWPRWPNAWPDGSRQS